MSKWLYIFDPGHGGIVGGKYTTSGKRSPKFSDGSVLYEGVNNRDNVKRIMAALQAKGIECVDIVNSEQDIPLSTRVARANKLAKTRKCLYISIHSDAAGNGVDWYPAKGISVYTSPGLTKSDMFASILINELHENFGTTILWREDNRDGDSDKEENFYVVRETSCPAVLAELGFHTSKDEAARMLTSEWKTKVVDAVVESVEMWEKIAK